MIYIKDAKVSEFFLKLGPDICKSNDNNWSTIEKIYIPILAVIVALFVFYYNIYRSNIAGRRSISVILDSIEIILGKENEIKNFSINDSKMAIKRILTRSLTLSRKYPYQGANINILNSCINVDSYIELDFSNLESVNTSSDLDKYFLSLKETKYFVKDAHSKVNSNRFNI